MKPLNFNKAEFITAYGKLAQIPESDRPEFAFSGRSNVGKSSLINKIFNRKNMARVSSVPGKTVTINFFAVEDVYFVDLPGYGYANVSKGEKKGWGDLIGGYLADFDRDLELVFQLIDMRHAPSKDDLQMINYLIDNEIPFVIVLTKADKLKPTARKERMEAFKDEIPYFEDIHCIPFSAVTGEGVDDLKAIIEEIREDWYARAENAAEEEEIPDDEDDIEPPAGFLTPNRNR